MTPLKQTTFLYRNGLSLVVLLLMLICWTGQSSTGWKVHNEELAEHGQTTLSLIAYTTSGHFMSATFENWKSEFLQMAM